MFNGEVKKLLKSFEDVYKRESEHALSLESKLEAKSTEMSKLSEKYIKLEGENLELKQLVKQSEDATSLYNQNLQLIKESKKLKNENIALFEKCEKFEMQLK